MAGMRWSIIRLIWARELRDQLRDRRTVLMIVGLPVLLYPLLGIAVVRLAQGFLARPSIVGIQCSPGEDFPERRPRDAGLHVVPELGWLTLLPAVGGDGPGRAAGAAALVQAGHAILDYPLLLHKGELAGAYEETAGVLRLQIETVARGEADARLADKAVDLLLAAPPDFLARVAQGQHPPLTVKLRARDERSRQAALRLKRLLDRWRDDLRNTRLARQGLPSSFDEVFEIKDEGGAEPAPARSFIDVILRVFPFMLVMWALAGALYPAVDLCAGEKERGTMETLLISPAGREEIVWGKFLTIWVFSAGTSLLNVASMGLTTLVVGPRMPQASLSLAALCWVVLLMLPLSAFFSAISLAVGAYARSTKEGQYYLMPLFLVSMPLIFLTLAPGVELNPFYSMVPVTGVGLLMQRLMSAPSLDQVPWFYFLPVLAPIVLYSWLALRWAIVQFQREEVLFREAERLDLRLWLRRLLREKEATPTTGQAMFCFALLLVLRWLSLDLGATAALPVRSTVIELAFVAAPPLFMALLLTTRPRTTLNLRLPRLPSLLAAALLLPLAELARSALERVPAVLELLQARQLGELFLLETLKGVPGARDGGAWLGYLIVLAVLPAVCEEIAFRGLILNGLRRRFRPWPALFLCSFLFAVYHSNVFAAGPLLVLGVVLGLLALYSGSIWPGALLHAGCRILLLSGPQLLAGDNSLPTLPDSRLLLLVLTALVCTGLAVALLWRLRPRGQGPLP
jgi:sodium transport system permease protein